MVSAAVQRPKLYVVYNHKHLTSIQFLVNTKGRYVCAVDTKDKFKAQQSPTRHLQATSGLAVCIRADGSNLKHGKPCTAV